MKIRRAVRKTQSEWEARRRQHLCSEAISVTRFYRGHQVYVLLSWSIYRLPYLCLNTYLSHLNTLSVNPSSLSTKGGIPGEHHHVGGTQLSSCTFANTSIPDSSSDSMQLPCLPSADCYACCVLLLCLPTVLDSHPMRTVSPNKSFLLSVALAMLFHSDIFPHVKLAPEIMSRNHG